MLKAKLQASTAAGWRSILLLERPPRSSKRNFADNWLPHLRRIGPTASLQGYRVISLSSRAQWSGPTLRSCVPRPRQAVRCLSTAELLIMQSCATRWFPCRVEASPDELRAPAQGLFPSPDDQRYYVEQMLKALQLPEP